MLFLNYTLNAVLYKSDFPTMCLLLSTNHAVHKNVFSSNTCIFLK